MQIKFRVTFAGTLQDLMAMLRKQYSGIILRHQLGTGGKEVHVRGKFGRCTYILSDCVEGCAVWQYIGGAGDFLSGDNLPKCVEEGVFDLEILYINPGDGTPIVGSGSLKTYLESRLKKWNTVNQLLTRAKKGDVDLRIALCRVLDSDPKFAGRYL